MEKGSLAILPHFLGHLMENDPPIEDKVESGGKKRDHSLTPARRYRRQKIKAVSGFIVPLAIAITLAFALNGTLTLLDPDYGVWSDALDSSWGNQSFTLSGLEHQVTVIRDGAGTEYIYASDDSDLFYAQGYTQASDRLFQMEAQSLEAQGNLSSWVGSSAIGSDMAFRYLGIPGAAAAIAANLPNVDPVVANYLESYSAGVNAFISYAESHNELPLPFKALGVLPYKWTPFASLCFERLMVLSQTSGIVEPLEAEVAAITAGDANLNAMYPIYSPYWENFTVLPGNGTVDNATLFSEQGANASYVYSQDWSSSWATGISPAEQQSLLPLYRAAIFNLSDPYINGLGATATSQGVGSNSWVVAANKTGIGMPLLANDPHLPLQLPSLWVPTELIDPDFDVGGYSLAGLPGILIGHNEQMAWGLTFSGGASAYDYVETLNGDSYLNNGSWVKMTFENQTIQVASGSPVTLDVPWTNNGPIVARIGNLGISVRWDGTHATYEVAGEFALDQSVSISQITKVLENVWDIPTLNFMLAEHNATTGANHIGWVIPTHYHLIKESMPNNESVEVIGERAPLNGSGAFEPVATLNSTLSPAIEDPARGYIYAPNQASVGQDYPFPFIGGWWDPGGRAHTIGTYLNTHPMMTVSNMQALQANVTDSWAVMSSPVLTSILGGLKTTGSSSVQSLAAAAYSQLQSWNGSFYPDEIAPTVYTYWWDEIESAVYAPFWDRMELNIAVSEPPDPNQIMALGQTDPNSSWFPGGWNSVMTNAATSALELLDSHLGTSSAGSNILTNWQWGTVHQFFLPSILGYTSFGLGPYPQWGDSFTPSVAPSDTNLTFPLTQSYIGSSLRMVTVPAADPSFGVIPGGTSGNIGSNYYDNQFDTWFDHGYFSLSLVTDKAGTFTEGVVSTWTYNP